jgi:tRNA-specific 2-thiouridylase
MRVLVAMSGGVDSSVAAALMVEAGHDVEGVTLKLWGGESDTGCCAVSDTDDARRVARRLGIAHHVFNYGSEFEAHVVAPYAQAHAEGRTPNPCIECNRHLKFDALTRRAAVLGFDAVATGHHARVVTDSEGRRRLARGVDQAKDQSYVLHMLGSDELARLVFPVGEMTKADVRQLAADRSLPTATKADSQDVCFVTRAQGRQRFLEDRIELHTAPVVDGSGRELGRAEAVELVTIGQRRGLTLAGGAGRRYVTDVDVPGRRVTVGNREDLAVELTRLADWTWAVAPLADGTEVEVQTSAHGAPRAAVVDGDCVRWSVPSPRVAPGQAVVLYQRVAGHDVVAGGGLAV